MFSVEITREETFSTLLRTIEHIRAGKIFTFSNFSSFTSCRHKKLKQNKEEKKIWKIESPSTDIPMLCFANDQKKKVQWIHAESYSAHAFYLIYIHSECNEAIITDWFFLLLHDSVDVVPILSSIYSNLNTNRQTTFLFDMMAIEFENMKKDCPKIKFFFLSKNHKCTHNFDQSTKCNRWKFVLLSSTLNRYFY